MERLPVVAPKEKKMRRQWRSQSSAQEPQLSSTILEDFFQKEIKRSETYGEVVPQLRACLAEQGDATAQLELAREVLVRVAGGEVPEGEVEEQEELAMYWLLRAAEQGQEEARGTVVALAGEGRGVSEHNYVDVAAVVQVSPLVAEGQYLGRTLFRTLSQGQEHVTAVQLARLAGEEGRVECHRLLAGRIGRAQLEESCCQYLEGRQPRLHAALSELASRSWPETLLRKRVVFPLLVLLHSLPLLLPSYSLHTPHLPSLLLLACSLSLHGLPQGLAAHHLWSKLLTTVVPGLDTGAAEAKAGACLVVLPSLLFNLLLLQSFLPLHPLPPHLLATGCFLSCLALPGPSPRLLLVLLAQLALSLSWPHLAPVLPPAYCSQELASCSLLLLHLLPSLFSLPPSHLQAQLQALVWETLALASLLGSRESPHLTLLVLATLGFTHATYLSLRKAQCRLLLVTCLALLLTPLLPLAPSTGPPSSLSWPEYQTTCLATPSPGAQATCLHLSGLQVAWQGQVVAVSLDTRTNWLEEAVALLPPSLLLLAPVPCLLGEPYKSCGPSPSPASALVCRSRGEEGLAPWQRCHLESWASYSYSLVLRMPASALFGEEGEVVVEVAALPPGLGEGARLAFTGMLGGGLRGGAKVTAVSNIQILK